MYTLVPRIPQTSKQFCGRSSLVVMVPNSRGRRVMSSSSGATDDPTCRELMRATVEAQSLPVKCGVIVWRGRVPVQVPSIFVI
ncbi:hypothetical protein TNCV_3632451 [Trichonephila clavipes]|nr:hypothetical protein TNCV_3632451 [Trichonephila clavipes]